MSSAMSFTQNLPAILLAGGVVLLSLFLLLTIRGKLKRASYRNDPKEFIRQTRESAIEAAAAASSMGIERPAFRSSENLSLQKSKHSASTLTNGILPTTTTPATTNNIHPTTRDRPLTTEEVIELEATVRRLTAHLDTRAAVLAKLIRDADQRIEEVQTVIEHTPVASISPAKILHQQPNGSIQSSPLSSTTPIPPSPNQRIPPTPVIAGIRKTTLPTITPKIHDTALVQTISQTNGIDQTPFAQPAGKMEHQPRPHPEENLDPLTNSVYELSDRGLGAISIAQDLDEHIGKVELILALRSA